MMLKASKELSRKILDELQNGIKWGVHGSTLIVQTNRGLGRVTLARKGKRRVLWLGPGGPTTFLVDASDRLWKSVGRTLLPNNHVAFQDVVPNA